MVHKKSDNRIKQHRVIIKNKDIKMKGNLYVNHGCIIDNCFNPTDHVISLNSQLSSHLGVVIGT